MVNTKKEWENKVLTVCNNCKQNLRVPVSYKPLHITCPKCKKEFLYNYIGEFGNNGKYYTEIQVSSILLKLFWIAIDLVSIIICIAINNIFGAIMCIIAGIILIPQLIDYKTFAKYKPIMLLVINRQGIIYFDEKLRAKECLNWGDIKSTKYIYKRHKFAGLIETKREPACIELDMGEKGKVIVPPAMFFSDKQRIRIIDDILKRFGTNSFFGMYS